MGHGEGRSLESSRSNVFDERGTNLDPPKPPCLRLLAIAQTLDDRKHFLVGDKSPPVQQFILIDGAAQRGGFIGQSGVRIAELSAFGAWNHIAGFGVSPIDKRFVFCCHERSHSGMWRLDIAPSQTAESSSHSS